MVLDQLQVLNRDFEIEILETDKLIPLKNNWDELLNELKNFGKVTVTTYNDSAYIKKSGIYDQLSFSGPVGQALTREIDLRLFLMHWHYGVIARTKTLDLYFFDKSGALVHQINILAPNDTVIDALSKYFSDDSIDISFENCKTESEKNDEEIDKHGLQCYWKNLNDTYDFFRMLKKFNVSRTQALRLGSPQFVIKIAKESIYRLLKNAVDQDVSIMAIIVGSKGCIQIHTDPISILVQRGPFLIVDEENLYLSLNTDNFKNCYIVKKPTKEGVVTSVEVFNGTGEMIVQFFGERKPGTPELESWRNLLCTI